MAPTSCTADSAKRGDDVFAVNPNADTVEGDRTYASLTEIDGGVDEVVVATSPDLGPRPNVAGAPAAPAMSRRSGCTARSAGSVCDANGVRMAHGMTVIDGGCPLMFDPVADPGHKVMRLLLTATGKVPRRV